MLDAFSISAQVARRVARRSAPRDGLPPGPSEPPVWQLLAWIHWPIPFLREMRRRYGPTFTVRFPIADPLVLFSEPDAVKEIFTAPAESLHAGEANVVLEPLLGKSSVLLLDGPTHMRQRKLLLPPFHGERMHAYGAVMRDATLASMRTWPRGRAMPIHPQVQAITLDVILRTVFGLEEGTRMEHLRLRLWRLLDAAQDPYVLVPWLQVDLGPLSPFGRILRLLAEVDAAIYEEIGRRRALPRGEDILSMLIDARDEEGAPMSDSELRDELVTLLVAGHETTATSLAWAFAHLCRERAVLARAREELDRAFPDGRVDPGRAAELPYLDAIVRETLRLRPVVPMVGRRLQRPMRIGGFDLPEGVIAAPSIWLSHMNEKSWPEPERFRPERFLEHKVSPYAFFPFGGGIRRCIGMAFALYEMKVVLATVLTAIDPEPVQGYEPRLVRRGITFAPSEGTPIRVRDRR